MDKPISFKEQEEWLKARLGAKRKKTEILLVVEADGRIVGNCHISRRLWKERHRATVGIVLAKTLRGKGVAAKPS